MNYATSQTFSNDEWLKYMPPMVETGGLRVPDSIGDEDPTLFGGKNMSSPENSCTSFNDINIKEDGISKPSRRRSRASRKTPMVLLNTNAKNFRALVQQYTGCHSSAASFKGPINLSFGGGDEEFGEESVGKFGYKNTFWPKGKAGQENHHHHYHQQQQQHISGQQFYEVDDQESAGDASISANLSPAPTVGIDNDIFNDLPVDYSSNMLEDIW